jgi:hypothetical protein
MFFSIHRNANDGGTQPGAARSSQLNAAFDSDSTFLLWLAEVITGDSKVAEECLVDARTISEQQSGLFVDWLAQWARSATIQQAIQRAHGQILCASHNYDQIRCPHGGHVPTPLEDFRQLHLVSAQEIVSELDPFVRAVGILRGVSRCAIQDCSIRLAATRTSVAAACCVFEQWTANRYRAFAYDEAVRHCEELIL